MVHCANGDANECDAAILTVPIPLLREIVLPPPEREKAAVAANIGFGNIIKILLRFETRWWLENRKDLADLTFLLSDASIPVWWTQHPADFPVLTGWFGGPKTEAMAHFAEHELIEAGIASLADIFDLHPEQLTRNLVTARAISWANDPFARGAYSYATLEARRAQSALASFAPWMKLERSVARKTIASAISSAVAGRPAGASAASWSRPSPIESVPSVRVGPGLTALMRTPLRPYSAVHVFVSNEYRRTTPKNSLSVRWETGAMEFDTNSPFAQGALILIK